MPGTGATDDQRSEHARRSRLPPRHVVRSVLRFRRRLAKVRRRCAPPAAVILETALAVADTVAMRTLASLRIPDRLDGDPKLAPELAAECGVDADRLDRLLRFAVSRGLLDTTRDSRFANNRITRALRSAASDSMRELALFAGAREHLMLWSHLEEALHGQSGSSSAFGRPLFEQLAEDPEFSGHFHGAMESLSRLQAAAVLDAHDFSTAERVCDVGGGTGTLLAEILASNRSLHGTLFDLPEVVAQASATFDAYGVADRVQVIGGSFFDAVPAGADCYLLQSIVHDWDDDSSVEILSRTHDAIGADACALVVEHVLPSGMTDHPSRYLDMEMLVGTEGGKERTMDEYRLLFQRARLQLRRSIDAPPLTIFELDRA